VAEKKKLLLIADSSEAVENLFGLDLSQCDIELRQHPLQALVELSNEAYDGVLLTSGYFENISEMGNLASNDSILEGMPDGVVVLDENNQVIWGNRRFRQWCGTEEILGENFYAVLGSPEILGPDFCPFHTALTTGKASISTLRNQDNHYFQVHAAPISEPNRPAKHLIISVRDVTRAILQQQKLTAIHRVGMQLADLTPNELLEMSVGDRIELLKSNILHCTKDLLNFDVVEIRLLNEETGDLIPLLSMGMDEAAQKRPLKAQPHGNGVTGFVAATKKSYLCEDTTEDPIYLTGSSEAKSSLTVPLLYHDKVIGTFNVESPEPRAFTESDLQFLEIFTKDVAAALNTLELLSTEKASAAAASVEAIHSAVALPVDEILNDTVNVIERYIGHEPEVCERLQRILRNSRDIKMVIQKVGQKMAPAQAHPLPPEDDRPLLRGKHVLLADEDASVRIAAHDLLDRYGCVVETAPTGEQALLLVRNGHYDAIIADIRLPDMSGHQFMLRLKEFLEVELPPLILMTGFGYDPGHSLVKARQAGLKTILYKPFRLDQLLNSVEHVIESFPNEGEEEDEDISRQFQKEAAQKDN
jgi:CheY-like chemotaxis protein